MQTRAYDIDTLFRGEKPELASSDAGVDAQVTRVFATDLATGDVPAADRSWLADTVASRTGISQADAQKRVDDVINKEKADAAKVRQAADTARKSASAVSIFTALSMLIGAFIACVAAAYGGSLRDNTFTKLRAGCREAAGAFSWVIHHARSGGFLPPGSSEFRERPA